MLIVTNTFFDFVFITTVINRKTANEREFFNARHEVVDDRMPAFC